MTTGDRAGLGATDSLCSELSTVRGVGTGDTGALRGVVVLGGDAISVGGICSCFHWLKPSCMAWIAESWESRPVVGVRVSALERLCNAATMWSSDVSSGCVRRLWRNSTVSEICTVLVVASLTLYEQ